MMRIATIAVLVVFWAIGSEAREPNQLQGARSPYLLQHLFNPVDWHRWGTQALEKAKRENKLIFISVGYASCHWCHVMERESFENEAIAAMLNSSFVSIKIDRETRPDLDEQFLLVTELLAGTGGWPNSVFLTPDGEPVAAGGYYPPAQFKQAIGEVLRKWAEDRNAVRIEAAAIARKIRQRLKGRSQTRPITQATVKTAVTAIQNELDPFNGGYGVVPKFPREPMFLFLLDHAERTGDASVLTAVTDMLDAMIIGGIHDHVGGGFHRYAVDPDWDVPHFEKMLYNQALIGRLLIRAWRITGKRRYYEAARRLFDYVLRDLQAPGGGFYAAQDADSLDRAGNSIEGAYYTWSTADLEAIGTDAGWLNHVFRITPGGNRNGESVLRLRDLPEHLARETGEETSIFRQRLDQLFGTMSELRNKRASPLVDRKILVAWNAAMIETLAEAAVLMRRPDYRMAAEAAAGFILSRMNEPDGLKRVWFDGSAETPAQLHDYAGLALALVALHDHGAGTPQSKHWLSGAQALAQTLAMRFGSAATGFRLTGKPEGLGEIVPVDDNALPSGNALTLTLFARLRERSHAPEIDRLGYDLAAALSGRAVASPAQRGFALKAIQDFHHGPSGAIRYLAKGAVRAELLHDRNSGKTRVEITIAKGWHINAHKPLNDYSIATVLGDPANAGLKVTYPEPVIRVLSFADAPLAVYEGKVEITALQADRPENPAPTQMNLRLQACSDEICLGPDNLVFYVW